MMRVAEARGRRRGAVGLLLCVLMATGLSACSKQTDVQSQPAAQATAVPTSAAEVPSGWVLRRGPGFRVAVPPQWLDRPEDQRAAPEASLEVGVPYTGQRYPPPLLMAFVERDQVGPLPLREKVLRMQIQAGLPDATIGTSTHVQVAGALDALYFDEVYTDSAGTSVLDTPIDATEVRQRELIVETPGLPKFGFRYAAPSKLFDESLWQQIVKSLVVVPAEAGATAP